MPANVRSTSVSSNADGPITATRPATIATGDVLWAAHVSDTALAGVPAPSGWSVVRTDDGIAVSVRILRRTVTGGEPTSWTFPQGNPAAGGVVIMSSISGQDPAVSPRIAVLAGSSGDTIDTPSVTPAASSHLEWRVAAAFANTADPNVTITGAPIGYQLRGQAYAGQALAGVATRQISSSAPSGVKVFQAAPDDVGLFTLGVTLSIPSADATPDVPPIPADAPGQGDGLYLYRFSRLFGGHLGDLAVHQPSFEKRISRRGQLNSGNFQSSFPISNEDEGDLAMKIVPRYQSDLLRGPGVTVVDVWRAGIHWGRSWITGAKLSKTRRQKPVLSLSGASLEAYFQYVQLEETLPPFTGIDRVEVMRQMIDHMQAQPYANLGLTVQAGESGSTIDRTFEAFAGMYGQHIASTTDGVDGHEWMINSSLGESGLEFEVVWGAPLGNPDAIHTFTDSPGGGNILDWGIEWTPLTRGTRFRARGDTIDSDASTVSTPLMSDAYDSPHLATGVWPRIDRVVDRPGVKDVDQLNAVAEQLAATSGGAPPVFSITVLLGEEPSIHPNMLGDAAHIVMTNEVFKRVNGGAGLNEKRRILGMRVSPTGRETGRDEAELFIDDQAVE